MTSRGQGSGVRSQGERMRRLFATGALFSCIFLPCLPIAASAATFSFDDIRYWVGTGDNRAALVIDWVENAADPPALVWGYRWDGVATGADMLRDVVTADNRLFAKFGGSIATPVSVYGLGYDTNDDGVFALDDSTTFNSVGIAITEPADAATSITSGDHYAEGWYLGFWHYGMATANPFDDGAWADAPNGMAGRNLANGDWDSWTYSPTFNFASFGVNPQAAPSPFPPGDYNQDGSVGMADFTRWKELYGSSDAAADGNGNGIVDAADYTIWRNNLGMGSSASSQPAAEVPEPHLGIVGLLTLFFVRRRRTRNTDPR
jgi:hypothetical protein